MSNFCNPSESRKANKEQEPIAWAVYHNGGKSLHWHEAHCADGDCEVYTPVPLYASPQPQLPRLTDEEIIEIAKTTQSAEPGRDGFILPIAFARAVEAKVRGEA